MRLAHIGSKTKFKGYYLVQAVLRSSHFANLELTVVEQERYGGAIREDCWGSTSVRFVGKTVSEEMHLFYATQDVLLAPSLWPEPFGLVTREAVEAGLWVVASDRGAIGEDVLVGHNGWVIDVATSDALRKVLTEIDEHPENYLSSPRPVKLRTARDQAVDLLRIYSDVASRPDGAPIPAPRTIRAASLDQKTTRVHDLRLIESKGGVNATDR